MIDTLLASFKKRCRKMDIELEIGFQGYKRGTIKEADLYELISQILEDILKISPRNRKIAIKARSLKNQLVISAGWNHGMLKKKNYQKMIRRYQGMFLQENRNHAMLFTMTLNNGNCSAGLRIHCANRKKVTQE